MFLLKMIYFVKNREFGLDFLSESITIEMERTALCRRVSFVSGGCLYQKGI